MRRLLLLVILALVASLPAANAYAGPDPAKLAAASESFEAGARAFSANRFEEAAAHFEAADAAAPSAKALRLAIKSRKNAGNAARAASLAALALDRYPNDDETKKLAKETLDELAGRLHRVGIACSSPCLLAAGNKIVHGQAASQWTIYLDPGKQTIGASFEGKTAAADQTVTATAGGFSTIRFSEPHKVTTGGPPIEPPKGDQGPRPEPPPGDKPEQKTWRIHPAFFITGLIVTAGLGGATIWSGVDTIKNPGADAVREQCAGQGEDCQLYKDGQAKEVRTNAMIGATAGVGAITVVLAIVTNWAGKPKSEPPKADAVTFDVPRLWVEVDGAKGSLGSVGPDRESAAGSSVGFHLELGGRF